MRNCLFTSSCRPDIGVHLHNGFSGRQGNPGIYAAQNLGNVLLTIAFIVLSILEVIVLYLLWRELLGFVGELFEEVKYRVFS